MEEVNRLFNNQSEKKPGYQEAYLSIKKKLETKNINPKELLRHGFIPLDPTNEFFTHLEAKMPSKTCFLRLQVEPSDSHLTLKYKITEKVQKISVRLGIQQSWFLGIPLVNCVAEGKDFVSSDSKLEDEDLESFTEYLNDKPKLIFEFLAKQTGIQIGVPESREKDSGKIHKITDHIFLGQITTTYASSLFYNPKLKRYDPKLKSSPLIYYEPDYFLISSNQITQILKLAKELENKPAPEIELHEVSKNPRNSVSPEESQINQLHTLINEKDQQAILDFIPKCTANVLNASTHRGSALHRAAAMGNCAIAEALINHGAKISQESENGQIALHYAVMRGHYEKKLLELLAGPTAESTQSIFSSAHACINIADERGHTALYYAIITGNSGAIEILHGLGAIAQITFPDAEISDPYLIAVEKIKKPEQLKAVLKELGKYYPINDEAIAKNCLERIDLKYQVSPDDKKLLIETMENILASNIKNIQTRSVA